MTLDVLHVLASSQRRGAETFGLELHREFQARGHRSAVVALEPGPEGARLPVPALAARRYRPSGLLALRRAAVDAQVAVAHGSSTLLACGAGLAGARVPFVYLSIGDPRYWARSGARRARVRFLLRRAAAVVAICEPAREVLIEHFGLIPERVHVVPNARSGQRFAPADAAAATAARAALGVPLQGEVVAVIGALRAEKRVDVAIRAVAALPGVHLVVAGEGGLRTELAALGEQEARGLVHFVGATDQPEQVLAAADAVLLSSDSEGVPGVLIEAGLAGLPVASTEVGWVSQVVVDGVTGRLTVPGEPTALATALREVLDRRDELGAAARRHCLERFELAGVVAQWERLLAAVADPRPDGRLDRPDQARTG